jgi:hypothetical protein
MKSNIVKTPRDKEGATELSFFTCSECGTECSIMKKDKDMWIEPKETL